MHDGQGMLFDFDDNASLKTLGNEYGDPLKYIAGQGKEQLDLSVVLMSPDGFVAWASENESKEDSMRPAVVLWFARKETLCTRQREPSPEDPLS
jgi:hypothetical protein